MEIALIILFVVFAVVATVLKDQGLNDPTNRKMIYADQMGQEIKIVGGPVRATLIRQSGNLYKDLGIFDSAFEALAEVQKSFRRAQIDSVAVQVNTEAKFSVVRLHHSHRGRAEGKKMGGACIQKF